MFLRIASLSVDVILFIKFIILLCVEMFPPSPVVSSVKDFKSESLKLKSTII